MTPPAKADYTYELGFSDTSGLIHRPHYTVTQASLATVHTKLFASTPGAGSVLSGANFIGYPLVPTAWDWLNLPVPGTATLYLTERPAMDWQTTYQQSSVEFGDGSATQTGTATLYSPGSNATESWNAYPLHPAPNVNLMELRSSSDTPRQVRRHRIHADRDQVRPDLHALNPIVHHVDLAFGICGSPRHSRLLALLGNRRARLRRPTTPHRWLHGRGNRAVRTYRTGYPDSGPDRRPPATGCRFGDQDRNGSGVVRCWPDLARRDGQRQRRLL